MTQDQVIQVLQKVVAENQNYTTWTVSTPHLVALVNHAIKAEREACAKVLLDSQLGGIGVAVRAAYLIRARGEA